MAFLTQRFIQAALKSGAAIKATQLWDRPECVRLAPVKGVTPSDKPPVRIFLGTEPAQYKAERVFIWSIVKVRDPARCYEIYLMKNLKGFKPRFWLTGFTNYRFAIPYFAGGEGRAIYNDVDQVYLKDPAELFDLPMEEHGYLAIDPGDISVALFDCEQMIKIWSIDDARTGSKNPLLARASEKPGLWGQLDGGWNARDREYVPGESGCVHFTILHRQPWHPLPDKFVYLKNPVGSLWYDLEKSANEAAFKVFSEDHPSQGFTKLKADLEVYRETGAQVNASARGNAGRGSEALHYDEMALAKMLANNNVRSLLHVEIAAKGLPLTTIPLTGALTKIQRLDMTAQVEESNIDSVQREAAVKVAADAVICTNTLEYLPDDDVPWVLDKLFANAGRILYCVISDSITRLDKPDRDLAWWHYQFQLVARHHADVFWRVMLKHRGQNQILEGNESLQRPARVWVINDRKPGHNSQAIALADMIGWPYEIKVVSENAQNLFSVLFGSEMSGPDNLTGPWPDVVVACGWWPVHVARWIEAKSDGRSRMVLAGRKAGGVKSVTDILVTCEHFNLPIHHRRIQTILPPQPITHSHLQDVKHKGEQLFAESEGAKIALFVGGSTKQHQFTPTEASKLADAVSKQAAAMDGSLFVVTSRRTDSAAIEAIKEVLEGQDKCELYVWSAEKTDNPYVDLLAAADILIVTGDSESMLTDAISTGKPVYIYPMTKRRLNPWMSLGSWLVNQSTRKPKNRRGTERPQQGFEYFCARILQTEWVLPPRDIDGLCQRLVDKGYASFFPENPDEPALGSITKGGSNGYEPLDLGPTLRLMLEQPRQQIAENPVQPETQVQSLTKVQTTEAASH